MERIRNFCIIAHIDHGKSTLADRLLELTGAIQRREMQEQVLDQMDLERERGITIKAKAVRLSCSSPAGGSYQINLIDTPGHVDFTYEVSRSLAACEGAVVVVDATQGVQAQTMANVFIAQELGLTLIPVINKVDLPNAEPERVAEEMEEMLAFPTEDIIEVSAKEGWGVDKVIEVVIDRVPAPSGQPTSALRALIFDAHYDPYKGVVAYVRVVDGSVEKGQELRLMATGAVAEAMEVGVFTPQPQAVAGLGTGEVGYVATGLKDIQQCQVGDTITGAERPAAESLAGYRAAKPMVFAGLYPVDPGGYLALKDSLEKLRLNDASLTFEAETSQALGAGFRAGFLGLLHLDIARERLEREYGIDLLVTAPSVGYRVGLRDGGQITVDNAAALPPSGDIAEIMEPWLRVTVVTPSSYLGAVMELLSERGGDYGCMDYLGDRASAWERVVLDYHLPLRGLLGGFFGALKSCSQGYASLDYTLEDYRAADLVKLEVLINHRPVDALASIVLASEAYKRGKELVAQLFRLIPRQQLAVAVQASAGGRVIARETIKALRKDVTAKLYGGDVTRKNKLLAKQAEGKKRLKRVGQVDMPREAFFDVLGLG
ncbi:MAG: translation elongation factor 4 [Dehalococcoidia bacterium]|nr:translation elongation factor 4 [Dehalococcoidia bacterium]